MLAGYTMVILTIFILIISLSLPFIKNNITSSLVRRVSAISFLCTGVLVFNTLHIQLIGSGIGLYSGLFQVNILTNSISLFLVLVSATLLLIWPLSVEPQINTNTTSRPLPLGQTFGVSANLVAERENNLVGERDKGLASGIIIKESYNNVSNVNKSNEYCLIVLFNILGALFLVSSSDLISMYLSIELQSFGLYVLATLYKEKLSATSAGLKYFLLGGLSSCIILLGSGLIYTYTGLTNLELIYTLISIYFNNYSDYGAIYLLNTVPGAFTPDSQILLNALRAGVTDNLSYTVGSEVPFHENIFLINDKLKGIGIGVLLIFSGFLFKIAASPFHNWAPDVYDDSPTLVTTWLTIMPKISILIFLLQLLIGIDVYLNLFSIGISQTINNYNLSGTNFEQILNLLFDNLVNILYKASGLHNNLSVERYLDPSLPSVNILTNLLLLSSLLSLIIGAIVGLSQIRIKRLLAYSTINHIGFLLLALSVFSNSSIEAFIFYIIQYTITNLNIFLIILALSYIINNSIDISYFNNGLGNLRPTSLKAGGARKYIKINISDIEYINSFKGLFYKNPILSLSFSICLFSFAGVPPLIGFFAKQQVLYSSNAAGYFFLSLIAIIVSVISAFYYLKIIKIIFSVNATAPSIKHQKVNEGRAVLGGFNTNLLRSSPRLSNVHSFIIGTLTISIMIFILNPELLLNSIAIITSLILNL